MFTARLRDLPEEYKLTNEIQTKIDVPTHDAILLLCKKQKRSRASLVREAIAEFLDKRKELLA